MAKGEGAESGSAAGLLPTSILQATERPAQVKIYLLDVAQVGPFSASIILFVGRAWDAITDPLVGFCISKSSWTCLGRLMPWIIFSTPLAVISYFLIWFVPDFPHGQTYWYLLFYCLFETMVTCFHVPYSALTMFISTEQTERDSATAYRMTVEVLGTVLGTAIQGQIVGQADTPCFQDLNNSTVASQSANHTHGTTSHRETAYLLAAGVIVCIYVICAVILTLGVREQREPYEAQQAEPIAYFRGLRLVMSHGPYIKLITGFLFTSLAFMLVEGNFVLFCTYTLGFRNEFQNLLLAIMLSATFTIPIWQWFLTRFGKKTAVYIGISSAVPFLVLVALMESNLIITYVVAVAAGISVAAAFLLPWSMLPDVIDDFHLKQPHFHGTEPIFFSFYVFFTKFASGVSLGISTLSLDFAGYQTRGCSQPERVKFTLNMLVTMAPIVLILLGLLLFKLYPIDEERRRQNKKALQALRDEASSSGCSETDSTELASIL
ncbi:sodium-dependent lysophosphatidylcholine symporter 1 isoform X5 [Piliocolobus tephrosceles]|uniref:sodium-dependent lysophosphatidylcholine symporter 1 isoform X3 n=1 Tax=Colobus angolensis palliatus TaxID=336983 RepID=UPI0005F42F54|nr:PREDICTED: sodium-dependent lysophosphatidylcholine symporter 1 isoform X3 [Colobus angolensis palliatus]XP_023077001.1 sodium-dependent lysophosphatidylcholine symporter 1 isoform X5 [Piliocolobus tephrosceles]